MPRMLCHFEHCTLCFLRSLILSSELVSQAARPPRCTSGVVCPAQHNRVQHTVCSALVCNWFVAWFTRLCSGFMDISPAAWWKWVKCLLWFYMLWCIRWPVLTFCNSSSSTTCSIWSHVIKSRWCLWRRYKPNVDFWWPRIWRLWWWRRWRNWVVRQWFHTSRKSQVK